MSEQDIFGSDVVGGDAEIFGATVPEQGGGPFITIHVKDVAAVAKAKGGAIGGLAAGLIPKTVESKVYNEIASQLKTKFKTEQNVDIDTAVVSTRPFGGPFKRDFLIGATVGAGMVGVGFGLVKLARHFFGRK